ncbi:MAG: TonB-dependent receptor [Bacteroidetes bacterium OLB11]|nr:MAG: TonB-dependent receptor [Bacteroidetes bacterium OLB11]
MIKKTFNVDKNITAVGGTAEDILRNVPSVSVDLDGNVSLRGKDGVNLLVDGKPSSMFGNDVATALQNIPAASIESVEVITNPSSKYEAQGMNGIVNIILKKDRKAGYNGMITLGAATPFRINGGINLNANVGKWNVFFNANGRYSNTWEETKNDRDNYSNDYTFSSFIHNDRVPKSGFGNFGIEYNMNKNDKISFSQSVFYASRDGNQKMTILEQRNFEDIISKQIRDNQYTGSPLNGTSNLQYKHLGKNPNEELNIELNYSQGRYLRSSHFETSLYDSSLNFINSYTQKNPINGHNWNGTFQIDYTRSISKNMRLDIGEKSYYNNFKSENNPTIQYLNQPEIVENILVNHYNFNQQVHGIYTNIASQFKNTGIQLGLRGEYFDLKGTVYQYNANVSNSYLGLFPTLFLTQKLSSNQDINFNYSRRVNRPSFFQLIPYIDVSNPQDTSAGNPNLKQEYIHSFELGYSQQYNKNDMLMVNVYFQKTDNLIQRYRRFNNDGTTFSQNQNVAFGNTYGLEITNRVNILPWWDATANVNIFRNIIEGKNIDANLNTKGFGGFIKLINNAKLPYGISTQLITNYYATTIVSQGTIEPYGNIDLAIKRNFFKNMISLTINANDILNTLKTKTIYNLYPLYNQEVLRKNQTRSLGVNLQIRFGNKSQKPLLDNFKKSGKKDKLIEKNREENLKKEMVEMIVSNIYQR